MDQLRNQQRRGFLRAGLALGAFGFSGLSAGFQLPAAGGTPKMGWLHIDNAGRVTLWSAKADMGQGTPTAWAMIVAEELDVPLGQIDIRMAPAHAFYRDPLIKKQTTYGSTGVAAFFDTLGDAAAALRDALLRAGARELGVAAEACTTRSGYVVDGTSGRQLPYAALAGKAEPTLSTPVKARKIQPSRVLGSPEPQLDVRAKSNGTAQYGIDFSLPGMRTALLARPPTLGATLQSFDAARAKTSKGIDRVFATSAGVAVVGTGFWPVKKARDLLKVKWTPAAQKHPDSEALRQTYGNLLQEKGVRVVNVEGPGAADEQLAVQAIYDAPFLAHMAMEPLSCLAHYTGDALQIWVGTQDVDRCMQAAVETSGLPADRISIHTMRMGGAFGRRAAVDFVRPAIEIAMKCAYPVKLMFDRTDDLRGGFYRPAARAALSGTVDAGGKITGFEARVVSSSVMKNFEGSHVKSLDGEYDFFAVQGLAGTAYKIGRRQVRWIQHETGIPAWIWRGVGLSQNLFFLESFIDELAYAAKRDPLRFRIENLPTQARARKVLELAAAQAAWGQPAPAGRARGIALHAYADLYIALVAEVSISTAGEPVVHRVTCAVDCGRVINPNIVKAQMEGGVVMGLGAALFGGITVAKGGIVQSNFHEMPVVRQVQAPTVDVHLIEGTSRVVGLGEFSTTTIAPAVANAIFALTGERLRDFPLRPKPTLSA